MKNENRDAALGRVRYDIYKVEIRNKRMNTGYFNMSTVI